MRGTLISFEGIEGSGKSTQLERLAGTLRARGIEPVSTREPGGTALGLRLREILLDPGELRLDPRTEAFLMVADRHEDVERVIRPALAAGRVVLADRYADSTLAYQGGGSGVDLALLEELNRLATGGLTPDLTLLFDLPVRDALTRLSSRSQGRARPGAQALDRFEAEDTSFHERVREAYRALARAAHPRIVLVDATGSAEAVEQTVRAAVEALLPVS